MNSRKVRRKVAAIMSVTMVMTSVLPSYVYAASSNDWDDEWIYDEDAGLYDDYDDYDEAYRAWMRSVASDSDAIATPSIATPSSALLAAVKSFNSEVKFVDIYGDEIDGDEKNIPETEDSFPYLSQGEGRTKGNIDLGSYGYEEKEYFISGEANIYKTKDGKLATASDAEEYVNRIIVFQPEDPADFSGQVYVEILNASSYVDLPDIWRRSYDYFMREGCVYIGVTSKAFNKVNGKMQEYGNVRSLQRFDKDRYDVLEWSDNGIIWDILGQVGALVKSDESPILYDGGYDADVYTYLIGQSQSGMYLNTFSNNFNHANYLMDEEELDAIENDNELKAIEEKEHIFDGFLNVVGAFADSGLNNDDNGKAMHPAEPSEVPFILLVGQNDYIPGSFRADADEEGEDMYRFYVVAGAPHSSKIFLPDMTDEIQLRAGRPAGEYPAFKMAENGKPHTLTDLNMDVVVNATLEHLHKWASGEEEAPAGYGDGIDLKDVDEFGNLQSGIVTPQIKVPVATYYGGANGAFNTDGGSMIYFDNSTLSSLYNDRDDYLAKYEAALDEMIEDGWILKEDKDLMMQIAENEPIFGNPSKYDGQLEEAMGSEAETTQLSTSNESADGVAYTDSTYMFKGEANVYGLLKDTTLYCRRMYANPYENFVRICVPENFGGEIVMDLIFNEDEEKDVAEYMKAGKAYVAITADPQAAEANGGDWKILKYADEPANPADKTGPIPKVGKQPESGLLWDIISQTVNTLTNSDLLTSARAASRVVVGADSDDADYAYTYETMFSKYAPYNAAIMNMTGSEKTVPLNSVDSDIKDVVKTSGLWSEVIQYHQNENGPTIGATAKKILEVDGLYFKDSNGNGKLDAYEDWRKDAEERAADLVAQMTVDDKIGMMFNNSRGMGINSKKTDATGLLDETENLKDTSIFGVTSTLGTTDTIKKLGLRHFILRQNPEPGDMASWINQMNMVAESTALGIPVLVTSNSRNENGQLTFGMNDASGVFSTWPGTMGIAAAAKGDGSNEIFTRFAEIARSEWDASGLKKGYMYMVDTMTDPRWQRTYGTFGEDADLIADAAGRLVDGFQGGPDGVQPNGVALTIKHFPGGGARENGFDPHYAQGQWNVYQTENSLQQYHLPGFKAAVDHNVSSIMPYYAKPAALKSATQYDNNGKPISMQAVGFAFNKAFIKDLLRDQMGHTGYINSDSGIINNMAWGVEELDVPERAAYAVNAGTDIIGDTNDVWSMKEAYERSADGSKSGYYNGRTIPYGFTEDEVTVTEEALNTANKRLLKEMFELGLFENPYRLPEIADEVVDNQANWDEAYEAHQKSVVLLKNSNDVLPLTADKLSGKKVYVEYFAQGDGTEGTKGLRESLQNKGITLTNDYNSADYAILFVNPSSGNYFSATQGYLELDICEDKVVHDVDKEGRPVAATHKETTLKNAGKIKEISDAVKAHGGKVVTNVNFTLAWMLGNVEPYSDAVLAGFDTYADATVDVILGEYAPTGKMPITLPKDDSVIAVDENGVCISPNDIPGYLKDNYMPENMKDINGKAYAYKDADGNYYEMNFGLSYDGKSSGQKWSDVLQYKSNGSGEPVIGATAKNIIEVDGKYFKDSNGNGKLDIYEDWRKDPQERAADLVSQMSIDAKIGMMFNNSRGMGINSKKTDATGLLDETENRKDTSIFGVTSTLGTTDTIKELGLRHFILRQNPEPEDMASWINQMNMVAESTALGIPVLVTSNSRNENGQMTFGMNDASGVFSTWPGTMGIAAAAKGNKSNEIFTKFANIARSEWDASGLKKGYMYMVDTMTDPRWQRTYGTFGEDAELIADAAGRLVDGFQGGPNGVQPNGVALTIKHFPGGGARENGFDPHYAQGQWNVYQTEDSLQKYHLPGFKAAVDHNVSSIMPYYAKPAALKSATQYDNNGKPISMQAVGFAFNKAFIKDLLRNQMGHTGYINSDSGIINNMAWGVEELDVPERAAYAINAGTDIIGDTNDVWSLREAYERSADGSKSDYYNGRTIPYGFTKDEVTVTEEALNTANERLLKEMFELGLFENPYRDPDNAKAVVDNQANWDEAYKAHLQSVVMLKNNSHVLPLTTQKLEGKSVYVEYFDQTGGADGTASLRENLKNKYGLTLTDDYNRADYAILFVNPSSGNYFSATQGYLELDICEDKVVHDVDKEGRPVAATHKETTLKNADKIQTISKAVKLRGGKVITNVNFTLAWMLGNVEPYSDALLAGFDTYADATMDVIMGKYNPTGKMPITLPKDDSVIAVDENGVCISPNDIPGYLKDNYMPDSMKDANGKAYAYKDRKGNYYEMNYGLSYSDADYSYVPSNTSHSNRGGGGGGGSYVRATETSGNWVLDSKGWWFKFNDGTWPAAQWMYLEWNGRNDWYYFNPDGYMATGWLHQDGMSFYLHNVSDGTMGHMYTGWNQIDGKWYFFNEVSDGTKGKMLVNTTTPDGYQVGADGVWIQ